MNRGSIVAAALLYTGAAFAQQSWWALARSSYEPAAALDTCRKNFGRFPSPAAFLEGNKLLGSPRITDRGDEVIADILMPGVRMRAFYFRTLEACAAAARANVAAPDPE